MLRRMLLSLARISAVVLVIIALPFTVKALFPQLVNNCLIRMRKEKTVTDRLNEFGAAVEQRLEPDFKRIACTFPPQMITFVAIKSTKMLEVWVGDDANALKLLKTYPILGASGYLGPKLKEGDRQVPEGLYKIEALNPNSRYHVALRVNYPNTFDKARALRDGRDNIGCDIMIHGNDASIGCLAMGNPAAEKLFVLAAKTGLDAVRLIIAPVDFRRQALPEGNRELPDWTGTLYRQIKRELEMLPLP